MTRDGRRYLDGEPVRISQAKTDLGWRASRNEKYALLIGLLLLVAAVVSLAVLLSGRL